MNLLHRSALPFVLIFFSLAGAAQADLVEVGTLSYDTFIPASGAAPGVDAFDIGNFTGPFNLPPDFPATDSLVFQSAVLTLTLEDASQQAFNLGDITPGFLLDAEGNPLVQVSSDTAFNSAELTATLAPTTFALAGGTDFSSDRVAIDVKLMPSAGPSLTPDQDATIISVSGTAGSVSLPEPRNTILIGLGLLCMVWRRR